MNLTPINYSKYTSIKQSGIKKPEQKTNDNFSEYSTGITDNYSAPVFFAPKAKHDSGLENAWADFKEKIKGVYGDMPISDVVDFSMTEDNVIGEGSAKVVYKIPDVDGYVIGREKRKNYSKQELEKTDIPFKRYNFGQPIAENEAGVTIMKKVDGKAHSLDNWSEKVDKFLFDKPLDVADAKEFLESIKTVSRMPVGAYIGLANQIKYLSDGGHRLDILSPNNVLIDSKKQQINLIDLIDGQDRFADFEGELDTVYDMQNILCGTILHEAFRGMLSDSEAKELDEATITTLNKCTIAGKYVGLTDDISNTINFYNVMDGFVSNFLKCEPKFLETYLKFADRYQDYINP